jgi:hypothetical protein
MLASLTKRIRMMRMILIMSARFILFLTTHIIFIEYFPHKNYNVLSVSLKQNVNMYGTRFLKKILITKSKDSFTKKERM